MWGLSDYRADPWTRFKPALLNQMLNDLVRGVRMNLELGRKRPDRRKCLARLKLAADERFLRGKHKLVKNGFARAKMKLEQRHMRTVTQVTVFVKNSHFLGLRSTLS